ncbi:MAG: transcriptional repressor [Muricomes sp.]
MDSREEIVEKLKKNGCRITRQRLILIDIILGNECQSCKEIYYRAIEIDNKIGIATVYRMVNALEEIGAINRKLMLTL